MKTGETIRRRGRGIHKKMGKRGSGNERGEERRRD